VLHGHIGNRHRDHASLKDAVEPLTINLEQRRARPVDGYRLANQRQGAQDQKELELLRQHAERGATALRQDPASSE
jgi:hypothetical protein